MNKAVFLDRDGTLNKDTGYVFKTEDLEILPTVKKGVDILKKEGYLLIIITNQSGIGRKYYTQSDFQKFNDELMKKLEIEFDGIYYCPHLPEEECACRKPGIQNILLAKKKYNIDISQSRFIGDKESDILCGYQAGCQTILLHNGQDGPVSTKANYRAKTFLQAVHHIIGS